MNKKGFSLAEMMVVMLVLTVVLAAATPIISKRAVQKVATTNAGTASSVVPFAQCDTDSTTADKAVTVSTISALSAGQTLLVKFTKQNTHQLPTLNINDKGPVPICNETGTPVSATSPAYFPAGAIIEFVYDGSSWVFKKRVVENYVSGASWYRVYSDGWIEQGNALVPGSGDGAVGVTVTFKRSYVVGAVKGEVENSQATGPCLGRVGIIATGGTTNATLVVNYAYNGYRWSVAGY